MISATVIGSSKIAEAHIKSLNFSKIDIENIATRENSENVINLVKKYNIKQEKILGWKETISSSKSNLIIIANVTNMHKEIAEYALDNGKYVICEKPGWDLDNNPLPERAQKIRFLYNRRFYSWVKNFRKNILQSGENLMVDIDIVECRKDFNSFYEISSHYIDLSKYLFLSDLDINKISVKEGKNFVQLFNENFSINYKIWNNASLNYSMRINIGNKFFEIKPIERIRSFRGFSFDQLTDFDKLYTPKIIEDKRENSSKMYKYGFNAMYEDVINWMNGKSNNLCKYEEELDNRTLARYIFNSFN